MIRQRTTTLGLTGVDVEGVVGVLCTPILVGVRTVIPRHFLDPSLYTGFHLKPPIYLLHKSC